MSQEPMSGARPRMPVNPAVDPLRAPPALNAAIRAAIAPTPAPRTPIRTRLALAVCAPPLAAIAVLAARHALRGTSMVRIDFGALVSLPFVLRIAALLVLTIAVTRIALRPGANGLGSRVEWLVAAACVGAPFYALMTLVAAPHSDDAEACATVSRLSEIGYPCAIVAVAVGVLALAGLGAALRGAVPAGWRWRGAALGAAAGLWAGVALFVHCPAHDWVHLVVGHVVPVAAFAVIGAVGMGRVLRP